MSLVFVTANLGSLPGLANSNQKALSETLISCLRLDNVKFAAFHFQETSGKGTKVLPIETEILFKSILRESLVLNFTRVLVFIDDVNSNDCHTGLASIYLGSRDLQNTQFSSFTSDEKNDFDGVTVYTRSLETCEWTIKHKFERKGRKGLLQTRWYFNNIPLDLVNIHLFQDTDNLNSVRRFPNDASILRREILESEITRLRQNPFAIFGDFNFRLNQPELIKVLLNQYAENSCSKDNPHFDFDSTDSEITFKDMKMGDLSVLKVGKKHFQLNPTLEAIYIDKLKEFIQFDQEPKEFSEDLFEFPITFPPSYPFSDESNKYAQTRCVAWCDRVFLSVAAKQILPTAFSQYGCLCDSIATGDHKAI